MCDNIKDNKKYVFRGALKVLLFVATFFLWSPQADARVTVDGNPRFRDEVNECLGIYRNTPGIIRDVIRELENSNNEHKIVEGNGWHNTPNNRDSAFDGTGTGTVTEVSSDRLETLKESTGALKDKDFCTALLHEMWHAVDADRGGWSNEKIDDVWVDEIEATIFQNFLHAIRGVSPRTIYGGEDISRHLILTDAEREDLEEEVEEEVSIMVVVINGKYYPVEQFTRCCGTLDACACDGYHLHSMHRGPVFSLDGSSITDPDPQGCGFGKIEDVEVKKIEVRVSVLDNYQELVQ